MTMDTRAELATRALRETLDSLLSPTLRDTLIGEALALAREGAIPFEPARFREFLTGPLAAALERGLGRELGRSVLQELERVTERLLPQPSFVSMMPPPPRRARIATSPSGAARLAGTRPRNARSPSPPARRATPLEVPRALRDVTTATELPRTEPPPGSLPSTMRPPPSRESFVERMPTHPARGQAAFPETRVPVSGDLPAGLSWAISDVPSSSPDSVASTARRLPLVLLSTRDSELVQRFAAWLDPRAAVVRVSRMTEILGDLDVSPNRRALIVLDCREPLIRPQALAGIADELPENVRVALWGAQGSLLRVLHQISPATSRWVVFSPEMAETDLAERCVEMVG
jgi:hypothetical protein